MGCIYGFLGDGDAETLHMVGSRLSHRGETISELVISHRVALGERLHHDATPLCVGSVTLVADADLYNVDELRMVLEQHRHGCNSTRPEEVIMRGYLAFGPGICERLHGDYAFALWDTTESTLLLARDPLGVRPLYYWQSDECIVFASEYKALLALPYIPAIPDIAAIQTLQHTKFPPTNRTLLRDISSVPAGHYLLFRNGHCHKQRFWQITLNIESRTEEQHIQSTREHFLSAVRRRIQHLPVIGATLSGGIDSAAVSAAIRAVRPDVALHTFTCGYGPDDPEMRTAELVARAIGSTHHPIVVKPDAIPALLPRLVWHLEDPIARSETVQIYETAREAAQYVPVVLAGYAADGLYAGMPKHKLVKLIERFPPLSTPFLEFYDYTQSSTPPLSLPGKLLHYAYYRGRDEPPPAILGAAIQPVHTALPGAKDEILNHMLISGVMEGVPKWLPKAERLHMAHGLQFRSPFTDIDLIQNAFTISGRWKIHHLREKYVLRKAMQPLLPAEVLNRPKFPQAMNYDLAFSDVIESVSQQVLTPAAILARGFFRQADLDHIRRRPAGAAYSPEQATRLWTAVLTELWARIFVDQRGAYIA